VSVVGGRWSVVGVPGRAAALRGTWGHLPRKATDIAPGRVTRAHRNHHRHPPPPRGESQSVPARVLAVSSPPRRTGGFDFGRVRRSYSCRFCSYRHRFGWRREAGGSLLHWIGLGPRKSPSSQSRRHAHPHSIHPALQGRRVCRYATFRRRRRRGRKGKKETMDSSRPCLSVSPSPSPSVCLRAGVRMRTPGWSARLEAPAESPSRGSSSSSYATADPLPCSPSQSSSPRSQSSSSPATFDSRHIFEEEGKGWIRWTKAGISNFADVG